MTPKFFFEEDKPFETTYFTTYADVGAAETILKGAGETRTATEEILDHHARKP